MDECKPTRLEIFAVGLDDAGLWLVSGDKPWLTDSLKAGQTEHGEVELELWRHGIDADWLAAIHSTSWRDGDFWRTDTYMVALAPVDAVREWWPQACPVTVEVCEAVGPPKTHAATEAPDANPLDVARHGLGHYKWLITVAPGRSKPRNATIAKALGPKWAEALRPFDETLAGMYEREHVPAA